MDLHSEQSKDTETDSGTQRLKTITIDEEALFSDVTANYVTPMEPEAGETVRIRFRIRHANADAVWLLSDEKRIPMHLKVCRGEFDYYEAEVVLGAEPMRYFFEIRWGTQICFYDKCGVTDAAESDRMFCIVPGFSTPDWAKGAVMYQIYTDRFRNGDRHNDVLDREYIYIGEPVAHVLDWDKLPAAVGMREFYGGDLQGVMEKLDYLQELGVEVLYFNPLFVSPSNHKYDTQDYDYIDPHFGRIVRDEGNLLSKQDMNNQAATRYISRVTAKENLEASNALFIELVEELHRRGMKIILDGVFNHCGSFHKWLDRERIYEGQPGYEKGAFLSADSPYRSYFRFYHEQDWPCNASYDGWWGHDTLPKLNYEGSEALEKEILRIARKWVSPPYNADGWRLDVAADLGFSAEYNHAFWRKFRKAVKEANPNAIILAEHYGDSGSWLQGDQWDTVMNYDAFMEPMSWFFTGMEKHSDEYLERLHGNAENFKAATQYHMARFLAPSLQTAMNQLSNHDHSRFLTRTNGKVGRVQQLGSRAASEGVKPEIMREAIVMQMTWPGAPTLYYGDEAGVCGFTDPDNRRTYPWGHEDKEMLAFYRSAIALHKRYPVFTDGSLVFLHTGEQTLAYGRFLSEYSCERKKQLCEDMEKNVMEKTQFCVSKKNEYGARSVIVFNNSIEEKELCIPVWQAEIRDGDCLTRVFYTDPDGFTEAEKSYLIENGSLQVVMPPRSAAVIIKKSL